MALLPSPRSLLVQLRRFLRNNSRAARGARSFLAARAGNVAMMFALAVVPLAISTSAAVDYTRALIMRQNMLKALDAAALAVGNATGKPASCTSSSNTTACQNLRDIANRYFGENYEKSYHPANAADMKVDLTLTGQQVTLKYSQKLEVAMLNLANAAGSNFDDINVHAESTVVWGQTRLWVALVLDVSGSMDRGDKDGTKIDALKDALNNTDYGLLKTLENAASTQGDVKAGIVPFSGNVNPGLSATSSYLDWNPWEAPPLVVGVNADSHKVVGFRNVTLSDGVTFDAFGEGDSCPFTDSNNNRRDTYGFSCTSSAANSAGNTSTIPSSGSSRGYICPGRDYGSNADSSHNAQYYNGCWTSAKDGSKKVTVSSGSSSASCTGFSSSNCSCSGSGKNKVCQTQRWTHKWVSNNRNTWTGCVVDRQRKTLKTMTPTGPRTTATKDYDTSNLQPVTVDRDTLFPVANTTTCNDAAVVSMPATWTANQWTVLKDKVKALDPAGSTNQAIGVEHGWQMLTPGNPYGTGVVPENTSRVMILFSDGLNTQNRWWGDGSTEGTVEDGYIDDRTAAACTAAKNDKITIYTIYVHIGSNGNSETLKNCASDSSKYYDLTASSQIAGAFNSIAQQITNLRVSK